jgi:2-polyprenyl-3-methyl-5-hydroxy-6-metoxy-1,4-benzoquinol methylase
MILFSEQYKQELEHQHKTSEWGIVGQYLIPDMKEIARQHNYKHILDYGSGSGNTARNLRTSGFVVHEYEPGVEGKSAKPDPCEFVICTDVLEHIEPDYIDNVLKHISTVTLGHAYFSVCHRTASRLLTDGRNAHLIVEKYSWWENKISQYFNIEMSSINWTLFDKQNHEDNSYWLLTSNISRDSVSSSIR